MFSGHSRPECRTSYTIIRSRNQENGFPFRNLNNAQSREYLAKELGRELESSRSRTVQPHTIQLEFDSIIDQVRLPFQRIAPVLRAADLSFVNLETPLTRKGRRAGAFRAPPELADALRWAGVDIVSIANNHTFDVGEEGLLDTTRSLWRAGVGFVGAGRDLEDARRPFVIERGGLRFAFLGYTHHVNLGDSAFATPDRSGPAPMDPLLIAEDIRRVRDQVDYVAVSIHWARSEPEKSQASHRIVAQRETHPVNRRLAHEIIDAGADFVLGHHPPRPKGLEIYKGKLIVYSPGYLIFGYNRTFWGDNCLIRTVLTRERLVRVEVLPVAGKGNNLAQPYLLEGDPARELLEEIRDLTAKLDTHMEIRGNVGVISP
jgi:poly-gamma-glutamate synthesis protein (capsule biosynthesis protein)